MGPFKNEPWIRQSDSKDSIIGFKATVYGITFLIVCLILSFFALSDVEDITFSGRFKWSLISSISLMIIYIFWRHKSLNPSKIVSLIYQGFAIWTRNFLIMFKGLLPALGGSETKQVILNATKTTVMLMFIIANALIFAHVLASERIPQTITEWMLSSGFNWFTFLIAVNILLLIGGQFMEPSGLLLIVAPVVFPIAIELGIDPIRLGIIMVVNMEIGMITPPIGLNLFVTSGITGMSLAQVVKAAFPFMVVLFIFLILVTYVPWLSTWLPTTLMGPEIISK